MKHSPYPEIEKQAQIAETANYEDAIRPEMNAQYLANRRESQIKTDISKISNNASAQEQADLTLAAIKKANEEIK
jgi:hypothetical protein